MTVEPTHEENVTALATAICRVATHPSLSACYSCRDAAERMLSLGSTWPMGFPQVYRDYEDFVDKVALPLVEADGDEVKEAAALAGFRTASPYYLCVSLVMMRNRVKRAEDEAKVLRESVARLVEAWTDEGSHPAHHRDIKAAVKHQWPTLTNAITQVVLRWKQTQT